jgi:hypothetical protein
VASNAGKRLEKLAKSLDAIAQKNKRHHFVVVQLGEDAVLRVEALAEEGVIRDGDDVQTVSIPWTVRELRGATHIPEGSADDPYADPRERTKIGGQVSMQESDLASSQGLDLPPGDQQQRWKDHERKIEMDGQRYKGTSSH